MKVTETEILDLKVIEMKRFADERGFFVERFHQGRFAEAGLNIRFVQDNHSRSHPRVLRGLHYQYDQPQGKLVGCVRGRIWDVAVDLRRGSSTFGRHVALELNEDNGLLLWIPAGFAHGFCVLGEESAELIYKVDAFYNPRGEGAIHWADQQLAIQWPIAQSILSSKDHEAPSFAAYCESKLAQTMWWSEH
jgi:dTDP-4-dehydrorhamnose 3,5-epimerase